MKKIYRQKACNCVLYPYAMIPKTVLQIGCPFPTIFRIILLPYVNRRSLGVIFNEVYRPKRRQKLPESLTICPKPQELKTLYFENASKNFFYFCFAA